MSRWSKVEGKWFWLGLFGLMLVLRLPSFLQTWWYGDENIYMAIGQAITKGQWLYVDAWDHKPPMIYLVYALSYWLFGNSLWPLRLLNAILAFLGVVAFYWLSSRLFGLSTRTSQVLAVVYTFALSLVFEGPLFNTENWFMPLIWLGLVCLVIGLNLLKPLAQPQFGWWLLGSVLWSLAAFSKMHAVLEIAILTLVLIVIYGQQQLSLTTDNPNSTGSTLTKLVNLSKTWVTQLVSQTQFWRYFGSLVGLMVLPYLVTGALYWFNGYWPDFYFAVWGYNQDYITYAANSVILFGFNLSEWSVSGNQLHLFLLSLWLVTSSWLLLQHHFSQRWFWFTNWLGAAMCAVLLSERNYPHYMLQVLPLGVLGLGLLSQRWFTIESIITKVKDTVFSLLVLQIFTYTFAQGSLILNYYSPNTYFFEFAKVVLGQQELSRWQAKFSLEVVNNRDLLVGTIQKYTTNTDKIFLIANQADLYFLSERLSGYKFLVDFHYPTEELPQIVAHLERNNTKLVMIDQKSPKAEAATTLLVSHGFVLVETVLDRYHFWLKPSTQFSPPGETGERCLGVTNQRC